MSNAIADIATAPSVAVEQRGLWPRQIRAILALEARKSFLGKRALLVYVLAMLPVGLLFAMATFGPTARKLADATGGQMAFAFVYEGLILRAVIFFGCAWVFMNLFRGDIVDRSLHYYLLAPVRREILVLGKYIAGLVVSIGVFGLATIACLVIVKVPRIAAGTGSIGLGVDVMLQYLLVTALACVGYGALFLSIGLLFRNPVLPALMVYGWELINFLLPPVLKKLSVIHYLQSISPIHVPEGPFAILADPTPAWIGIPGLLLVTLGLLAFAAWRTNRLEIRYAGE